MIEVTERFSALPPPLNIGLTLRTLLDAVQRKITTGFMDTPMISQESLSAAELVEMAEAKKAKARVARKLLFALRRKEEDEADTQAQTLKLNTEQIASVQQGLKDLTWKLDELTRAVTADRPAPQGLAALGTGFARPTSPAAVSRV